MTHHIHPDPAAEVWWPVAWPDGYEASNHGRVRSNRRREPYIKKPRSRPFGHLMVDLSCGARTQRRMVFVHVLVLEAFVGPRPEGMLARHLDGDPTNNHLDNLAWGTPSENIHDQVRHGTHPWATKTHCPQGHEYDEANTYIRRGRRCCRECDRIKSAAYRRTEKYRIAEARRRAARKEGAA